MYKTVTEFLKRFFKDATIYKYGFNWSPMYRRTTARLIEVSDDLRYVKIKLKPSWKNLNYAGSIFGGSMLASTDPIYMIQLIQILGQDFVVWDKTVEARYKRPAKTTVYGEFIFTEDEITDIKEQISSKKEIEITKTMQLIDKKENIIAIFSKTLYVADKMFYKQKLKNRKKSK